MPRQVINQLALNVWCHLFPSTAWKKEHLNNLTWGPSCFRAWREQSGDIHSFSRKRKRRQQTTKSLCVPPRAGGIPGMWSFSVRGDLFRHDQEHLLLEHGYQRFCLRGQCCVTFTSSRQHGRERGPSFCLLVFHAHSFSRHTDQLV